MFAACTLKVSSSWHLQFQPQRRTILNKEAECHVPSRDYSCTEPARLSITGALMQTIRPTKARHTASSKGKAISTAKIRLSQAKMRLSQFDTVFL
jgi:hypothetical protein